MLLDGGGGADPAPENSSAWAEVVDRSAATVPAVNDLREVFIGQPGWKEVMTEVEVLKLLKFAVMLYEPGETGALLS
jgi:hypothetical protein